jgi:hypothetical protein
LYFDSLRTDVNLYYIYFIYKTYNLFIRHFPFEGKNNNLLLVDSNADSAKRNSNKELFSFF